MKPLKHTTAKPSHYNKESESYDEFNDNNSENSFASVINSAIEAILQKHHVKTVLDCTCGTGSQVFWLTKRGYEVVGADINAKMLAIAKKRAKQEQLPVRLLKGDMRTIHVGTFDAVVTISNAVGHLTKDDFETAMCNIRDNLRDGGLYIFDIFNLTYLLTDNRITKLTIDWQSKADNVTVRKTQYSTIDHDGILASYTIDSVQQGTEKPKITKSAQTLQIYTVQQLREMLGRNGFVVLEQCNADGTPFVETDSERMLIVAQKVGRTREK